MSDDTDWMTQIGAGLLLESGMAKAFCSECKSPLEDTDEPDYKICPKCGEKYWVVVGFSGHDEGGRRDEW